jgi:hypothetical protein
MQGNEPKPIELNLAPEAPKPTLLAAYPDEMVQALEQARVACEADRTAGFQKLREVAARWPAFVDAWALLAVAALDASQMLEGYGFSRSGYLRGLDRLRGGGWRGAGPVPWSHAPNQGVIRAVYALMRASAALGEEAEAVRCRQLLLDMDPNNPLL